MAVSMTDAVESSDEALVFDVRLVNLGMATAANIPMIATTKINSTIVNAFRLNYITFRI